MKETTKVNLTVGQKTLTNSKIKEMYEFIHNNFDKYCDCINNVKCHWKQINKCQAWYDDFFFEIDNDVYHIKLIKSYNTIVAIYLPEFQALISFGRYSMTTYQHIRKFRENNFYRISHEYNMEYVNWF